MCFLPRYAEAFKEIKNLAVSFGQILYSKTRRPEKDFLIK